MVLVSRNEHVYSTYRAAADSTALSILLLY